MESLFSLRKLTVDGVERELLWPTSDVNCFPIIGGDWAELNPTIIHYVGNDRGLVLQAGGNCGMYPMLHSYQFERVITFEPDPVNFYCLSENCKTHRVSKFNAAVGERAETTTMGIVTPDNVGMHKVGHGGIIVQSLPIDALQLVDLSLLHLDVEGYELPALRGARQTIEQCRPVIAIEISEDEQEIRELLTLLNYREVHSKIGASANYIFVPGETK